MGKVERKEDESLLGFYKRITDNRKELGLSYEEWGELIVGENRYSSDNCRKALYLIKPLLENLREEELNKLPKNMMDEIKEELGELFIVKQEAKSKLNKLGRLKRDFAKSVEISNDIKESLGEELKNISLFNFERIEGTSEYKLIIQLSDLHIGYIIKNYKGNTYNYEILRLRLAEIIKEAKKICDMYDITEVIVVNTGDVIEHVAMRETQQAFECEFNLSQQILKAIKTLYEFVTTVSEFANVRFISVGGNHSRASGSKNANIQGDNSNIVILGALQMLFAENERVEVVEIDEIDDSCEFEVNGLKFLALHGDNRPADCKKLFDSENVDVILRGHFHNFNVATQDNGGYVITCGSAFGYNPYSKKSIGATAQASQTLILVGDKKIEFIKDLNLHGIK